MNSPPLRIAASSLLALPILAIALIGCSADASPSTPDEETPAAADAELGTEAPPNPVALSAIKAAAAKLGEAFTGADTDKDGVVTEEQELPGVARRSGLSRLGRASIFTLWNSAVGDVHHPPTEAEVRDRLETSLAQVIAGDLDGNGMIERTEFNKLRGALTRRLIQFGAE